MIYEFAEGGGGRRGVLKALLGAGAAAASPKVAKKLLPEGEDAVRQAARLTRKIPDLLEGNTATGGGFDDALLDYLHNRMSNKDVHPSQILDSHANTMDFMDDPAFRKGMTEHMLEIENSLAGALKSPGARYYAARFHPARDWHYSLGDDEIDRVMKSLGYPKQEALPGMKIGAEHLIEDPKVLDELRGVNYGDKSAYDAISEAISSIMKDF